MAALRPVAASSAAFCAAANSAAAVAAACCAAAACWPASCTCVARVGGLGGKDATGAASAKFHIFTVPSQSPPTTRAPSWVKVTRSAASGNAGNDFSAPPFPSQALTVLSLPPDRMRPSCVNATLKAPPPCAPQLLIWLPSFISHSRIVPSSPDDASTFESPRQLTSNTAPLCPRRFKYSRPVAASQTNNPPLRSAVASNTPSGLNCTPYTQSVCFFI